MGRGEIRVAYWVEGECRLRGGWWWWGAIGRDETVGRAYVQTNGQEVASPWTTALHWLDWPG